MTSNRLDQELVRRGLVASRSQGESYIKLGKVRVTGKIIKKAGYSVRQTDKIELLQVEQYVSRAGMKLAGAAAVFNLDFKNKVVLDVGSSTGGFSDFVLKHGAKIVIAVDVGTEQLHPALQSNKRLELHEKTDIRSFKTDEKLDTALIDTSFISLREILPAVAKLASQQTQIVAMVKPQFEAGAKDTNKGVVKNDTARRKILKDFELWAKTKFVILDKADSEVPGAKGNLERFYLLRKIT